MSHLHCHSKNLGTESSPAAPRSWITCKRAAPFVSVRSWPYAREPQEAAREMIQICQSAPGASWKVHGKTVSCQSLNIFYQVSDPNAKPLEIMTWIPAVGMWDHLFATLLGSAGFPCGLSKLRFAPVTVEPVGSQVCHWDWYLPSVSPAPSRNSSGCCPQSQPLM